MARLARIVVPGHPHHVTQRGNRGLKTFFGDEDYRLYRELLAAHCADAGVEVWAYCLMPNHVHLILTPGDEDGLRRALGEAHRRYTRTSMRARAGAAICGRSAFTPSPWTRRTFWRQRATSS